MAENILIVDDEKSIADLVEVYLTNEGYHVYKFYTAAEALSCIETQALSLVILDVMLPDMDGFCAVSKDSKNASFSHHHAHCQGGGYG